ncbi:MAG TPA: precorrin-3B synthase [Trebonia sp.]|nr:precorrin-3B synthase [Trebonia sp.]
MPETSHDISAGRRRAAGDRCPGVLRLAEAADGCLARIRLPGGLVTGGQLRLLARMATELGDGRIELTSRGNVQLRALAVASAGPLTTALIEAGLLPSLDHDRVRNVLASPLAGLNGGRDLTGLVRLLDAALCARPRLAGLPGRFLFAIDDGRGDVAGLGADVVAQVGADRAVVNGLAVRDGDADAAVSAVVTVMLACAEAFLDERAAAGSTAWRIADLPGGAERVRAAVAGRFGLPPVSRQPMPHEPALATAARPVGIVPCRAAEGGVEPRSVPFDGLDSVVLLAPLGRLTAAQVTWLADRVAGRTARITPWRSVVLPDQADAAGTLQAAASLGFGVDDGSPWLRVTACAGRPGCARALADVQADAAGFAARWPGRIVHVSGCGRHCGRPAATEIDATATSEGYQVAGV